MGCYIWYSEEGPGRSAAPPRIFLAVPNVAAHPSTTSVPTSYYSMWHYNCVWLRDALIYRRQFGSESDFFPIRRPVQRRFANSQIVTAPVVEAICTIRLNCRRHPGDELVENHLQPPSSSVSRSTTDGMKQANIRHLIHNVEMDISLWKCLLHIQCVQIKTKPTTF